MIVVFGALPAWAGLLEGARVFEPSIPEWCWRDVADTPVWFRHAITSAFIADLGRIMLRHTPR